MASCGQRANTHARALRVQRVVMLRCGWQSTVTVAYSKLGIASGPRLCFEPAHVVLLA